MKKKLLSIMLVLCMVLGMMPAVAATDGETPAAKDWPIKDSNGTVTLTTGTYALTENVTANVVIPTGETVVLNLNGHNLTNAGDHAIKNSGNLTIEGTGVIDSQTHQKGALYNDVGATATLNGGTFDRTLENGIDKESNGGNSWYTIKNYGTMTINDGVTVQTANNDNAKGKFSSLVDNGWYSVGAASEPTHTTDAVLTINGGTFKGGLNTIKNDDCGVATINGGDFSNFYQATVQNHNELTINGGNYTAATDATETTYGVYNCGCNATYDIGKLNITGGDFTATFAVADVSKVCGSIAISGGTFNGTTKAIATFSGSKATIKVTGGTFSSDPTTYLAEGYVAGKDSDGNFKAVTPKKVTLDTIEHGTVTVADKDDHAFETAKLGDEIHVTGTADKGYKLTSLTYKGSGEAQEIENGRFTMPDENVTVSATFEPDTYKVAVAPMVNGTVTVDETAKFGSEVTVTVTPAEGYELSTINVMTDNADGTAAEDIKIENNKFKMPASNVVIYATFKAADKGDITVVDKIPETKVGDSVKNEEDKAEVAKVLDTAEVTGVAAAAKETEILAASGVETTKDDKVEIEIAAKVEATAADLSGDTKTLTFSVKPVATIKVNGVEEKKDVEVKNDMLDGKTEITVKLPLPEGFEPKEIIHQHDDGTNEKVKFTIEDGVAIVKVTSFSSFVMNAKEHDPDWELIDTVPATDTTKGSKTYKCKVCGEKKTEDIDIVAAKSLKLDETKVTLVMDGEKTLKLTIDPETATGTPVWKSSNEKVVTVDGGKLKAVGTGVAAVTVTLGDQKATCEVSVICDSKKCENYTDVDADEWYHPAVDYVTDNKIMKGIDTKLYGPKLDLTRAQLAQILYNLETEPKNGETELTLTDVDTEEWYAAAVKWAASNEIVKGYPNKTFRPDDSVTRQDMVTMIARYAAYKKLTLVTDDSWKDFKDYEDVGEWAQDAMAWAVANGLVNGMTADTLVPNGTATRGQIAKIMMMFNSTYAVK